GEVDVRRPPGVDVVAPGVGAGPDGGEPVGALGVGEGAAHAGEVGVQRRVVLLAPMRVPPGRVGLPDLHQLPGDGASVAVQATPGDGDALPDGLPGVLPGEVVVDVGDVPVPERGGGEFDQLRVPAHVDGDRR